MRTLLPQVEALTTGLLDQLEAQGPPADLHTALALPLPILVICELLGVPYGDRDQFHQWTDDVANVRDPGRSEHGLAEKYRYGMTLVEHKRAHPAFDTPGLQLAYDTAFDTMLATVDRRNRLDTAIAEMAADSAYTPVVRRLGCLRGVSTLTAFGLAVEIGDWQRLNGRSIGAYLGLVPTESSSGTSGSQGSITKTGNNHARRLLIEAAWHHRPAYRCPGVDLRRRWDAGRPAARARGQQANRRLHARWILFDARKKRPVIADTAIAREMAGWCWSLAVLDG